MVPHPPCNLKEYKRLHMYMDIKCAKTHSLLHYVSFLYLQNITNHISDGLHPSHALLHLLYILLALLKIHH